MKCQRHIHKFEEFSDNLLKSMFFRSEAEDFKKHMKTLVLNNWYSNFIKHM